MLDQLQSIDPAVLAGVVRQDQHDPHLEITDWTVRRLSDQGIINPDGLFLFEGHGRGGQGSTSWSVVLKVLRDPGQDLPPTDMWYWKRELLAFQSGLLTRLPGPVAAPRFYGSLELAGGAGMWMEHIIETARGRWTLEQYAFAARQLGQFNGAYLNGSPLPAYPWLSAGLARTWTGGPLEELEKAWENSLVREAFSEGLRERCRQLWGERERFYAVLDRLPQVFSHFDFQRRNLLLRARPDGQPEVVAVDWSLCGLGALGGDLSNVAGMSLILGGVDLAAAAALDRLAFDAYMQGLGEAGWQGNPDLVRLGYAAWLGLWCGSAMPMLSGVWTLEENNSFALQQFGKFGIELLKDWAIVFEIALDRADEARQLAGRLL